MLLLSPHLLINLMRRTSHHKSFKNLLIYYIRMIKRRLNLNEDFLTLATSSFEELRPEFIRLDYPILGEGAKN